MESKNMKSDCTDWTFQFLLFFFILQNENLALSKREASQCVEENAHPFLSKIHIPEGPKSSWFLSAVEDLAAFSPIKWNSLQYEVIQRSVVFVLQKTGVYIL